MFPSHSSSVSLGSCLFRVLLGAAGKTLSNAFLSSSRCRPRIKYRTEEPAFLSASDFSDGFYWEGKRILDIQEPWDTRETKQKKPTRSSLLRTLWKWAVGKALIVQSEPWAWSLGALGLHLLAKAGHGRAEHVCHVSVRGDSQASWNSMLQGQREVLSQNVSGSNRGWHPMVTPSPTHTKPISEEKRGPVLSSLTGFVNQVIRRALHFSW